ncbi:MAG: orotate phosphoribosyltransferase [Calditrichaeota bacterium]|nr:MAG: orotate phosphoribosyltransferase [Calditrichota bacterium]
MDKKEILHILETTGALQNGHFLLSSGLHTPMYFQCAVVLQYPEYLTRFCAEILEYFQEDSDTITAVVAPAIGGIVVAQELGRQLNVRSMFAERENGKLTLRRGFTLSPEDVVLIAEDVITTGGSVQELIQLVESTGAFIVGVGCIVDRSGGKNLFDVPMYSVYSTRAVTYNPEKCPLCDQGIPLVYPGSKELLADQ